ncbi:MAG: sigma-54-dependent Fis family transcriptional regulator [Betaproteobacteria bacterium]|nr:sigma-54-dependent Fis family transcriptional regulator [Betaproteobacteria bacterium]
MSQILVVDDEIGIRELLSEILHDEGHQVRLAESAGEARTMRMRTRPDLVLLDIWMPDTDGITLLKEWATSGQLTMPVVMMSGHGTIDTAVEATRIGAYAFLEKPIALQKLLTTVGQALRQGQATSRPGLSMAYLGRSPLLQELRTRLENIRNLPLPVLFTGEPGVGKSLCAKFLHNANSPWVAPENFSVLGDSANNLVGQAAEGTLFLHEVSNLNAEQQRNLLQQCSKLDRYHTRVVSTTSKDLAVLVSQGLFDARLYSALSSLSVRIPSLREHPEDTPELARLILSRYVESREVPARQLSTAALNALRLFHWPGNLAQLESVVKSAALLALSHEITLSDVNSTLARLDAPMSSASVGLDTDLREAREAFERIYFEYHMTREGANISRVAERAGLERTHLYRKLKQLGIQISRKE